MIEVKHLKLIDAVAKLGSLSKAADELCLTQSALSHQLRELESRLGVKVFHRDKNQLLFTAEGKELRDVGSTILQQVEHLEDRVVEISQSQLSRYVHGYSDNEGRRLNAQAETMEELLHHDSLWEPGSKILEIGCGVGAQTKILAARNSDSSFVSIDLSEKSLLKAKETIDSLGMENVTFQQADVYDLPFPDESFDHVFTCFVLEHLEDPLKALQQAKRVLKKEGSLTVIEGDHGSAYFYPESEAANKAIQAQVELQKRGGGNSNIGRQLYPMLSGLEFERIHVDPRMVYVDASKPKMVDGFIRQTFTAMIEGVKEEVIAKKLLSEGDMNAGVRDLYKTAAGGTFCYTFFKARAFKSDG